MIKNAVSLEVKSYTEIVELGNLHITNWKLQQSNYQQWTICIYQYGNMVKNCAFSLTIITSALCCGTKTNATHVLIKFMK